ncbi:MAG TPA: MHYT domain-containing protein [Caulobacteraceae bacterium]|nr:MHYT domain-containing protein [Caulobacteraceae bacterium]
MFRVYLCISHQHDWRLLVAAVATCAVGACAAFWLYAQVPSTTRARRRLWLAMIGLVAGAGAWTTHFVAMLAFRTGLPTGYSLGAASASLAIAIAGCGAGFSVASHGAEKATVARAAAGGLIVGLSLTLMHYVGMAGYETAGILAWDPRYVGASIVIGASLATAALTVARPADRQPQALGRPMAGAILLMAAIAGMHFTGMAAVSIMPDPSISVPLSLLSAEQMAFGAIGGAAFAVFTTLGGVALNAVSRQGALKQLRTAIDTMPEGLAFFDADDRLVCWNRQYDAICAGCGPLTVGRPYADILRAKVAAGSAFASVAWDPTWFERRLAAHRAAEGSAERRTADGRWLQIRERRTDDGGIVMVCVDVTEMKHAEAALAQARDQAMAASRVKTEFLANMSHEIRTPMNGVMVMTDMLKRSNLDAQQRKYAEIAQSSAESLLATVNDVLDIARLEAGELELQSAAFNLPALVRDAFAQAATEASGKGLAATLDLDDGEGPWLCGDAPRIRQVLLALLSNAVKFTDRGLIALKLRADSGGAGRCVVRIEIEDTGIGLSETAKAALFQPFSQADSSATRRFGGSGLGLAISRRLIDLMGGRIGVRDGADGGSVFWFDLDLETSADGAAARTNSALPLAS